MNLLAWRKEEAISMSGWDLAVRWCTGQGEKSPNRMSCTVLPHSGSPRERPISLQDAS